MWKVAAGSILARALAASNGRCWCDGPQAFPSSRTKIRSPPECAGGQFGEERPAFIRQHDVARFARLALAHGYGSSLGVEVTGAHPRQFAVAAAGDQSAFDDVAESAIAGVHDPPALVIRQEVDNGRIRLAERLHLAPGLVRRDAAFVKGMVERGL